MTELAQSILVQKGQGSHEEVVVSVALASAVGYLFSPHVEAYAEWLKGPFTKLVRRGSELEIFRAHMEHWGNPVHPYGFTVVAFAPMEREHMCKALAKTQVSEFNRERIGWDRLDVSGHLNAPTLVINSSLGMSTGKTAAQAAHGLLGWVLRSSPEVVAGWSLRGYPMNFVDDERYWNKHKNDKDALAIHDAGRSEVEPGSKTVVVM